MLPQTKRRQSFSFTAPNAREVLLAGEFTGWQKNPIALRKEGSGRWKADVSLEAGRYQYRFIVDGQWSDDPACTTRVPNGLGAENCVCIVERPARKKKNAAKPS